MVFAYSRRALIAAITRAPSVLCADETCTALPLVNAVPLTLSCPSAAQIAVCVA